MNAAALAYLAAPALLFLASFVPPALGLPLFLALAVLVAQAVCRHPRTQDARVAVITALAAAVAATGVLALMGFVSGHFTWDWIKHWALLNSLEANPWPVTLELQGEPGYLRFYIGAYLVPAGLANATGWNIVACTALWYGLGLVLAFLLLSHGEEGAGRSLWVVPLLLLMGGGDAWAQALLRPEGREITVTGFHHEWWANALLDHPLQYGTPLCLLLWVPHQAIPAFIAVGLLRRLRKPADLGPTMLAVSMLALWSPYALIGAVVLLLPRLFTQPDLRAALLRPGLATTGAALTATAFVALLAWTLSHQLPSGGLNLDRLLARLAQPAPYLIFLAVELAIPLLVLRRRLFDDATSTIAVLTLVVLPWLGGPVPDAVMRTSMPALIFLFARCAHDIAQQPARRFFAGLALVLVLSGPTVWGEASFHVEGGRRHAALPADDPLAAPYYTVWALRTSYTAQQFFEICGWNWRPQYFTTTPPPSWPRIPAR